jgi:hypothetical protein
MGVFHMPGHISIMLLVSVALFAPCRQGWACAGRIIAGPDPVAEYNPFDPVDHVRSYTVTVENISSQTCAYELAFQPLGAGSVDFQIRSAAGGVLAGTGIDPAIAARLSTGDLEPDQSYVLEFVSIIPAGQMLAPGNYEQPFSLSLAGFAGAPPPAGTPPVDTAPLTLSCLVQQYLGVNIAGAGTATTIDFGELDQGENQRVVIEARSNLDFRLEAFSSNGGALAMEAPYQQWRIAYTMSLNGSAVTLPAQIGPFGETTIAGHALEVMFTIGDVSAKRAGLYTDEITIEIRPAL